VVACFVVSTLFAQLVFAAEPRATSSLDDAISKLERDSGLIPDDHESLPQRLSVVELKLFGKASAGPLVGRIQAARAALEAQTPPRPQTYSTNSAPAVEGLRDTMPLLNAIPPNFLRIAAPEASPDSSDYLADAVKGNKGKILRFKAMPVPVYINHYPDPAFIASVVKGFESWEDRTQGAVRFVQVEDSTKARIIVVWKHLGTSEDRKGCALGAHTITKFTEKGKGTVSVMDVGGVPVPIYIPKFGPKYTVPPQVIEVNLDLLMSKSPITRYRLLQNVVAHELGHALGLLGHSENTMDLMYAITDEHSRLSDRDINTLIQLYKQKVDVPL
jgi:hypothetical protein